MAGDIVGDTISKLGSFVEELAKQATGEKEQRSFVDTLCETFGRDTLDDLLEQDFDASWYNDEWAAVLADKDRKESTEGVRLRLAVVFLSEWKKALMRIGATATDVDALDSAGCAHLSSAYDSLTHTAAKLAKSQQGASNA